MLKKETLVRELRRLDGELDHSPSQSDVDQYAKYSHRTYINKFGSFNIAKQEAGLETREPGYAGSGEDHPSWKGGYKPYYGPSWLPARRAARERDEYKCQRCGMADQEHIERFGQELHVHHIRPLRTFEKHAGANDLDNLITLCRDCHDKLEGVPLDH